MAHREVDTAGVAAAPRRGDQPGELGPEQRGHAHRHRELGVVGEQLGLLHQLAGLVGLEVDGAHPDLGAAGGAEQRLEDLGDHPLDPAEVEGVQVALGEQGVDELVEVTAGREDVVDAGDHPGGASLEHGGDVLWGGDPAADAAAPEPVGLGEEEAEVGVGGGRRGHRQRPREHLAGEAVDGDGVALGDHPVADREAAALGLDGRLPAADDARLAERARHHRGVARGPARDGDDAA